MSAFVILNPYSNRWKAGKAKPDLIAALDRAGFAYELVESERVGHAAQLARQAVQEGYAPMIAAGGDGTIGEVLNGLYQANPDGVLGPLGIIPLGTANDLVNNLGLPGDLAGAVAAIQGGKTRRIDIGKVNDWVFHNNSAIGLEPVVSIYNVRLTWLRGVIRYLVAAVLAIMDKPTWQMTIRWDGGQYEGPVSLVSVGNCPVTGGMFRMAPDAIPTDGKLTFVRGFAPTRRKLFSLLPRAISGAFVHDPAVEQNHATEIEILCDPPTPLQSDGEVRADALTKIRYRVLPARLDIFAP